MPAAVLVAAAVAFSGGDVASGFAIAAPCVDEGVAAGLEADAVTEVVGEVPSGLETVAPWAAVGDALAGATVADKTFAVILAAPAELGVDPGEDGAPTVAVAGVVATAGAAPFRLPLEGDGALVLLGAAAAFVVTAGVVFCVFVGAMLTAIEAGAFALVDGAGLPCAVICTVSAGDDALLAGLTLLGVPAAFCAAGTVPAPGVPIPGNTVPCCKLPSFGWFAEGVEMGAVAEGCVAADWFAADCFSGKLIGGNSGGTGMGAGAAAVSVVGASGLRLNTFINGALAAGTGPFLRAVAVVSGPCTRSVILLPSVFKV